MILDLDDDGTIRFTSDTLGGTCVGIRRAGQPERVIQVQSIYESDIEQYVRAYSECEVMGGWNGLDDARDIACTTARHGIEMLAQLVDRLHVPIASRRGPRQLAVLLADTQGADSQLTDAERAAERVLQAIQELRAVSARATEIIGDSSDTQAAHGGHHQRPLIEIEIEGEDHVRH